LASSMGRADAHGTAVISEHGNPQDHFRWSVRQRTRRPPPQTGSPTRPYAQQMRTRSRQLASVDGRCRGRPGLLRELAAGVGESLRWTCVIVAALARCATSASPSWVRPNGCCHRQRRAGHPTGGERLTSRRCCSPCRTCSSQVTTWLWSSALAWRCGP
jgi:hypothetical protein